MSDLLVRIELVKLAAELRTKTEDLAFLDDLSVEQLQQLRRQVGHALFAPHEPRFKRLASVARLVPVPISARASQLAMGPQISARVAGSLDPELAVRLAAAMKDGFLASMAPYLDPAKVGPIVRNLPQDRIVALGQRLIADGEYLALGRFVSEVAPETALAVIEHASAYDLLQAALYTDDRSIIDTIVESLPDERIGSVMADAVSRGIVDDALTLLSSISLQTRVRAVHATAALDEHTRNAVLEAVARNHVWDDLLPVMGEVGAEDVRRLVNVPVSLDPGLLDQLLLFARSRDVGAEAMPVLLALDAEHREVLPQVESLQAPAVRDWLRAAATTDEARALLDEVLAQLG